MMNFITVVLVLVSLGHVVSAITPVVTGTFVPTLPGQCAINLKAFGFADTGVGMTKTSYIKVNGITYFDNVDTNVAYRGFNLVTLDINTCRASNFDHFDTHEIPADSDRLVTYINGIPDGAHVLGVTDDEATLGLSAAAKAALSSIGVDVTGLDYRGKLIFHAIKGRPEKVATRMNKVNEGNLFYEERAGTCAVCQNGGLLKFSYADLVCECPATHEGFYCEFLSAGSA